MSTAWRAPAIVFAPLPAAGRTTNKLASRAERFTETRWARPEEISSDSGVDALPLAEGTSSTATAADAADDEDALDDDTGGMLADGLAGAEESGPDERGAAGLIEGRSGAVDFVDGRAE